MALGLGQPRVCPSLAFLAGREMAISWSTESAVRLHTSLTLVGSGREITGGVVKRVGAEFR